MNEGDTPPVTSVQTSRRVVRIRPETYVPADYDREWSEKHYDESRTRKGRIGPIAIFLILLVGLIGGLVLYAGGAEFIAGLFGETEEELGEDLTLVTERPGADLDERSLVQTPGDMVSGEEGDEGVIEEVEDQVIPEEDLAAAEAEERRIEQERDRLRKEANELRVEERRVAALESGRESSSTQEIPTIESTGERETSPSQRSNASTPVLQTASSPAGRYVAQVSATPDRTEADRIAARLRAKGGSSVTVIAAEKNGAPIYRVRFGTFTSEAEARQKSSDLGFGEVWIIQN
jgi:cell division septation protein DedD